jgi:hypothetical protein
MEKMRKTMKKHPNFRPRIEHRTPMNIKLEI